jgi:hypothetical protein
MNISYELALELKNAGFPQRVPDGDGPYGKEPYYLPTLSELIAACGRGFRLENLTENGVVNNGGKDEWHAFFNDRSIANFIGMGATPEEAVARLYLALHAPEVKDDTQYNFHGV